MQDLSGDEVFFRRADNGSISPCRFIDIGDCICGMLASVTTDDQRGHDWQAIINAMFDRDVHYFHYGADGRVAAPRLSREQSGP